MHVPLGLRITSLLFLALPAAATGQSAPTKAFRQWALTHAHALASANDRSGRDADLRALESEIGSAQVVGLGEPIHDDQQTLEIRNRFIRYGVMHLGIRAVALETCLSSSKSLYDFVLGGSAESDSDLKRAFCYGFGDYPENLDLLRWLRRFNANQLSDRKVHLYGIDLSGQYQPSAYHSLTDVLTYLDHADPAISYEAHAQLETVVPVFRSDRYPKLTVTEKNACTGKIQDLVASMRRERTRLTDATSRDEYEWALRQAVVATQDDAFLRSLPSEFDLNVPHWWDKFAPDPAWDHNAEMREVAMADNVLWVEQRERSRGKVFYFAHDEHVDKGPGMLGAPGHPVPGQYRQIRGAGRYLQSALGKDYVAIGTYFDHGEQYASADVPDPAVHGTETLLNSLSIPQYLINLHELPAFGPLHEWFMTPRATRASISREATWTVAPLVSYDAILFISVLSPTVPHK